MLVLKLMMLMPTVVVAMVLSRYKTLESVACCRLEVSAFLKISVPERQEKCCRVDVKPDLGTLVCEFVRSRYFSYCARCLELGGRERRTRR